MAYIVLGIWALFTIFCCVFYRINCHEVTINYLLEMIKIEKQYNEEKFKIMNDWISKSEDARKEQISRIVNIYEEVYHTVHNISSVVDQNCREIDYLKKER